MSTKISALTAITSIADNDVLPVVDVSATTTKKLTVAQMVAMARGSGACTLEQFGAVGDGATDDSAAFTAAIAALNAGTYSALILGAKTYLVSGATLTGQGCSIVGHGQGSCLKTTTNAPIIRLNSAHGTYLAAFKMLGSSTGNLQRGLSNGYLGSDGTSKIICVGLSAVDMGDAGFSHAYSPETVGGQFTGCSAQNCGVGFAMVHEAVLVGCKAVGCGTGLWAASGNVSWSGGDIIQNTIGVLIPTGGNDAHGIVSASSINHNTTAVSIGAITNGHTFDGCHIYDGNITITGNTGLVSFNGCTLAPKTYTFNAALTRFTDCRFADGYFVAVTDTNNADTEFVGCKHVDGTIPEWLGQRMHVEYTFSVDANSTLSKAHSRAAVLDVQAGVITAERGLSSRRDPNIGERVVVVNRTPFSVDYYWSTGGGVVIPAAHTAEIGADGSKAICIGIEPNDAALVDPVSTFDPATIVLTGWWRAPYGGVDWLPTASAGTSGTTGRDFETGGTPPTVGTPLNGYSPASFNGVNQSLLDNDNVADVYLDGDGYTISFLFNGHSPPAPAVNVYDNASIYGSAGGFGVAWSTSGVKAYQNDGSYRQTNWVACSADAWHWVDVKYDGVNLKIRVDGGAWDNVASGNVDVGSGMIVRIGRNYASVYAAFDLAELMLADSPISDAALTNARAGYANERYGLTL